MPPKLREVGNASASVELTNVDDNSGDGANESDDVEDVRLGWCCCFKNEADRECCLIVVISLVYLLAVGLNYIPIKLLINKKIAGDAEHPNSQSVFVDTTSHFVHSLTSFACGRYTSGLGDYTGRKPVLFLSCVAFVVSRIIYLTAETPGQFYFAAIVAALFDCYYFTALAWVCDLFPNAMHRSKRVGLFTGFAGGFALIIGVPAGGVIGSRNVLLPLQISLVLGIISSVLVVLIPVDDTKGIKSADADGTDEDLYGSVEAGDEAQGVKPSDRKVWWGKRALPANWYGYMQSHFPISAGFFTLAYKAKYPTDWVVNFTMHSGTGVVNLVLVQFCLAVLKWSAVQTAAGVLSVGLLLGIFAPTFLHRFNPVPLAFYAMCFFTMGMLMFSIAGTGIDNAFVFGIIGFLGVAFGTPYVPSLQTNILSQYDAFEQGQVSGVLGQQNDLSLAPAYLFSLGFTLTVDDHDGPIYWPGSTFAIASCLGIASLYLHWRTYGNAATTLSRRKAGLVYSVDTPITPRPVSASRCPPISVHTELDVTEEESHAARAHMEEGDLSPTSPTPLISRNMAV